MSGYIEWLRWMEEWSNQTSPLQLISLHCGWEIGLSSFTRKARWCTSYVSWANFKCMRYRCCRSTSPRPIVCRNCSSDSVKQRKSMVSILHTAWYEEFDVTLRGFLQESYTFRLMVYTHHTSWGMTWQRSSGIQSHIQSPKNFDLALYKGLDRS